MITRDYYNELKDIKELPEKGRLLDIGSHVGRYSVSFHNEGWECVLVDEQPQELLKPFDEFHQMDILSYFKKFQRKFDIIIAKNVIPFLRDRHQELLKEINNHLNSGGIFIGDFFGDRDSWVGKPLAFHSKEEVLEMLKEYEILHLNEIEGKMALMNGEVKAWHRLEFIVKQPQL